MARVLGIDFETTGLLATEDRITEVGAVLYDWDAKMPLQVLSTFVHPGRLIPEEITKLTGITNELVESYGKHEVDVFADLEYLLSCADFVMAHKAEFDKGFYDAAVARNNFSPDIKPWLCTMNDIKYPSEMTTRNLGYLAAEHGFVSNFRHRAVFDVLTMLKVASNYDLSAIVARSKEPTIHVQAMVTFQENQKAKDFQFRWCAPKKVWWNAYKESDYLRLKDSFDFRTQLLAGSPE